MNALLLVDDDRDIRDMVEELFIDDYEVSTAANGRDALDMAEKSNFDLLITDLRMPDMGGADLIKKLRVTNTTIPVIVLSGSITPDVETDLLSSAPIAYVGKPFSADLLLCTAEAIIKQSKALRSASQNLVRQSTDQIERAQRLIAEIKNVQNDFRKRLRNRGEPS